ncbi:putative oocyte-secreted protein 1 homolog [Tamandua tetradactyla]|uniref:putative oocyte-secreted protein 1 homolog n=1 Tax=Tamandua tetradactyla TaxID=48850 RepID=UPI00405384B7
MCWDAVEPRHGPATSRDIADDPRFPGIKPTVFHNLYVNPEEVFLGDDCPVTHVVPEGYEFFYQPHECGITTKTLQETILYKTKIKYVSRTSEDRGEMPLSCVARNTHHLLNAVQGRNDETGNTAESECEIQVRIHFANLGQKGDIGLGVTSSVWPWRDLNVPFPYLSMMYLFCKRIKWVLHPYSEATWIS